MRRKPRVEKRRRHEARKARVVRRIAGSERPRLTVFRSHKHIYAQLVDAATGRTLLTVSTLSKDLREDAARAGKIEAARRVGRALAGLARGRQIDAVVFNRNGFLYHGRVKALAEAAREAGLEL